MLSTGAGGIPPVKPLTRAVGMPPTTRAAKGVVMQKRSWHLLQAVFRFPVLGRLAWFLVPCTVYSAGIVLIAQVWPDVGSSLPREGIDAVVTGIMFGWLMSFRATTAHARWWEGRVLWGQLVNESRNLSLKSARLFAKNPAAAVELRALLTNFAAGLRDHLRQVGTTSKSDASPPHKPLAIAGQIYGLIYSERFDDHIDGWGFLALDSHAQKLMDICGGCERIRNTPLTASYRSMLRIGIALYIVSLPWLIFEDFGWLTVLITALIGYVLIGLELIASSIEDPFGTGGDDLPLDDLVGVVQRSVAQIDL